MKVSNEIHLTGPASMTFTGTHGEVPNVGSVLQDARESAKGLEHLDT